MTMPRVTIAATVSALLALAIPVSADAARAPAAGAWKGSITQHWFIDKWERGAGAVRDTAWVKFKIRPGRVLSFNAGTEPLLTYTPRSTAAICIPYPYGGCWIMPGDGWADDPSPTPTATPEPTATPTPERVGGDDEPRLVDVKVLVPSSKMRRRGSSVRFSGTRTAATGGITYTVKVSGVFTSARRAHGTLTVRSSEDSERYRWTARR